MSRTKSRENAFKILFQLETKANDMTIKQARSFIEEIEHSDTFLLELTEGVRNNQENIDSKISPFLKKWTINRLSKVDRILLRMATYEINFLDTPDKVVVNEIINLAKEYSDDDSYKFINGVLSEIINQKSE